MSDNKCISDISPVTSFFNELRNGVTKIDSNVKQLKQIADFDFALSVSSAVSGVTLAQQLLNDVNHAKQIDCDVRSTYSKVLLQLNTIKGEPINLNSVEHVIDQLEDTLRDTENKTDIKSYGYRPWNCPFQWKRLSQVNDNQSHTEPFEGVNGQSNCYSPTIEVVPERPNNIQYLPTSITKNFGKIKKKLFY